MTAIPDALVYDPNSVTAVLSRLEANGATTVEAISSLAEEVKASHASFHKRFEEITLDVSHLKNSEKDRNKRVSFILALGGTIAAVWEAFVTWRHTS